MTLNPPTLELRPVVLPDDEEFLTELYYSTRDDLAALPLPDEQKHGLIMMQYRAQKGQYAHDFPDARHDIILYEGKKVGRYMVQQDPAEIIGVDLALLPSYRGLGIGTSVLAGSFDEARRTSRVYRFHVAATNRAKLLYERLGCRVTGETPTHFEMEWRPVQ
jgi:GNAT superfamily N-acetyltransferase